MAENPDPSTELTSLAGVTRTLDDWTTVFHLAVVVLPPRPEASQWLPVIDGMYRVLGDSDARTAVCVNAEPAVARRILGDASRRWLTFCDPDGVFTKALKLERLPAFVHLRQDASVVNAAEGWSTSEWQAVADGIAKSHHWSRPDLARCTRPAAHAGWPT